MKILLDTVFGVSNFRNEITWKRQSAHSDAKHRFSNVSDSILFYGKTPDARFNPQYEPHDRDYIAKFYRFDDNDGRGRYRLSDMASPNPRPNMMYEWRGFSFPPKGWRYQLDTMQKLHDEGRIHYPTDRDGNLNTEKRPALKRYLNEQEGSIVTNVWTDIQLLHSSTAEMLGYPTQKPVALLERIIQASSNEGDLVLDPFCGCGTTIAAAQKLNREWIGIDVTHLSVGLQKLRLKDSFNLLPGKDYKVVGQPEDLDGAKELAEKDKYGFQWWILPLIGAKAYGSEAGKKEGKKGADRGIDGELVFTDDNSGKAKRVMVSVKGGHNVSVAQIRDLGHVIERENAAIGVFLSLDPPTKPMLEEAAGKGFYHSPGWNKDYPRLQILTVEDLLAGKTVDLPPNLQTYKQAEKVVAENKDQATLEFGE